MGGGEGGGEEGEGRAAVGRVEEPDRNPVALASGRDLPEAKLLHRRRGRGGAQQQRGLLAGHVEGLPHQALRRRPDSDQQGPPGGGEPPEELRVIEIAGAGLEGVHAGFGRQVPGGLVVGLHDDREPRGPGRLEDAAPLPRRQLDGLHLLALAVAPHEQRLGPEDLEGDGVRAGLEGGLDQPERRLG
jgi:hypothetical protein